VDFAAISWILVRFLGFWLDFVDFGSISWILVRFCVSAAHFAIRRSTWRFDLVILRFGGALGVSIW
jgi:hypothetical protein